MTGTEYATEAEFDLNNPALMSDAPDFGDPEGSAEQIAAPPPSDGVHPVALFLRESEDKPGVYVKGTPGDSKLVAAISPRFVREDGTLGAYLKDFYPTTMVFQGQTASQIAFLCRLAGEPLQRGMTYEDIKTHVYKLFAQAGEEGIRVNAKTQWIKSTQRVDENGIPVTDEFSGKAIYDEVKGENRIKAAAAAAAKSEVLADGGDLDDAVAAAELAEARAHIYTDPVSGEERTVRAEIRSLIA